MAATATPLGIETSCPDQVDVETWGRWEATVGAAVFLWTDRVDFDLRGLVDTVRSAVERRNDLAEEPHWVRVFVARGLPTPVDEGLLDNEHWPALEAALASFPFPTDRTPYAIRLFLFFRPRQSA